ncbi:MAG: SUMF1/EgtB/PvdO family nonheme iron enzyme [Chitinivibrionales bacterium]
MIKKLMLCSIAIAVSGFYYSYALDSLNDIAVGKTYHMVLTTGDELEGVVDSKTDTSLILDCKGAPYTFGKSLIIEYKLVSTPSQNGPASGSSGQDFMTYDEVRKKQPLGQMLEVHIKNGTVFKGNLLAIDDDNIKLSSGSAIIPLAKSIIDNITISVTSKPDSSSVDAKQKAPSVFDTLVLKNPETDDYGNPKPNIVLEGKITGENNKNVSFLSRDNVKGDYSFGQIVQIFRHSQESAETDSIKLYAQALICPPSMILVDVPPGKSGRPFFKTCIDKYEYPNQAGVVPQVNVSYQDAENFCEKQGKRLCTSREWQWACSGIEGYAYSYGWAFDKLACNSDGRVVEPSGNRNHCTGKFGAYDMVGNVFEWVKGPDNNPAAMGGPLSKCQTIAAGGEGDAKPQTGFRCCKSN